MLKRERKGNNPARQIKSSDTRIIFYNGEFDPGSGRTLAAGLIHASRTGWSSNTLVSGARVRNAYATYLLLGDSPKKFGLIPHNII